METPAGMFLTTPNSGKTQAASQREAEYLRLVEAQAVAEVGSWVTDLPTGVVTWSTETYRIFGVSPADFQPTHEAFLGLTHPEDRQTVNEAFVNSANSDQSHVIEHRINHPAGGIKFIEERWKVFRDENGVPARAVGSCRDITGQKINQQEITRLSRLYSALSHVNKAIVRMPLRDELFVAVCDALVTHGGFKMAWVGWHDEATKRIVPVASVGDKGYLHNIKISTAEVPEGMGPAGISFRSGKSFISNNAATDPAMEPWRDKFVAHGYGSVAGLCLRRQGKACGTLAVFSDREDFFHDKEVALLEEVANDVSFALDNLDREEGRKKAEQELRRELDFSDAVIRSVPGVLYLYNEAGHFLRWNENFSRITGYTADDIQRMSPLDFIGEDDKKAVEAEIRDVFEKGSSTVAANLAHKDGRLTPYYFTGMRTTIEGVPCLVGVGIDLTERNRAESARLKIEQSYRTLFEYAPEGIVICDSTGRYLDANPGMCRMLGYTREEMIGKHSTEIVSPAEAPLVNGAIEHIINTAEHRREWQFLRKDGSIFPGEVFATQMPDGSIIGMIRDLTDRNRADKERENYLRAEAADRVKSAFLATMSHELRTPLNSIIGFTGIILQRLPGPLNDEQAKQLEMVRGSARHLLALISDVLDLSKIEAGQLSVHVAPFDAAAAISRAVESLRPLAEKKGLRLESVIPDDLGYIVSDESRFTQILLNLLSNAIKFTDSGQAMLTAKIIPDYVAVRGGAGQPALRIRVSDTGIGIKPEDLLLLFQPFRQLDARLSRRHEGTGLGLSICMKLAELLGGTITAESTFGHGSTFTFTLPLKAAPHEG